MTAHVERLQPGIYDDSVNMSKSVTQTPKPAAKPATSPPAKPVMAKVTGAQYFGKFDVSTYVLLLLIPA